MSWWLWTLCGFALLLLELVTPGGFYLMFFGIGAVIVGLMTWMGVAGPEWRQWLEFTVVSVILIMGLRPHLVRRFQKSMAPAQDDVDNMVGITCVARDAIAANAEGKVEMRGTSWNAVNLGPEPLTNGQNCRVERVQGLLLHVRPVPPNVATS